MSAGSETRTWPSWSGLRWNLKMVYRLGVWMLSREAASHSASGRVGRVHWRLKVSPLCEVLAAAEVLRFAGFFVAGIGSKEKLPW